MVRYIFPVARAGVPEQETTAKQIFTDAQNLKHEVVLVPRIIYNDTGLTIISHVSF